MQQPDTMVINGLDCTDNKQITDSFNSFFVSVGEPNNANIAGHRDSYFHDYLTDQVETQLHFAQLATVILYK